MSWNLMLARSNVLEISGRSITASMVRSTRSCVEKCKRVQPEYQSECVLRLRVN